MGILVYEASGPSHFKHDIFIGSLFVVPSLNFVTKTNLGFIPFLILCRDIFSEIN